MRSLRLAAVALALLVGSAVTAYAVTPRDLIELKKAGLTDAVLMALIDSDGSVFHLAAGDVRVLHDAGLSDALIIKMLKTAQPKAPVKAVADVPAEAAAQPEPIVPPVEVSPYEPVVVTVVSPPPPPIIVTQTNEQRVTVQPQVVTVPVYVPVYIQARPQVKPTPTPAPVYWGWGGQKRPDSWDDGYRAPASGPTQQPPASGPTPQPPASGGRGGGSR